MFSLSEENYLKTIFHLERSYSAGVSTNAIAEELETKASSVTDMVKKLSEKKLVKYRKYQGVKLSDIGKNAALEVIRRHRLWEYFLVEKLHFNWDEVHEVAEELEHIKSDKLIEELDRFLGFPTRDPHGDPIPDSEGNFATFSRELLAECKVGETAVVVGVKDSTASFLRFLDKTRISLGSRIRILSREEFDQSLEVEVDSQALTLSYKTASNLYIQVEPNHG